MSAEDIEKRLEDMREYYPSDEHQLIDDAIETIRSLRKENGRYQASSTVRDRISEANPAAMFIDGMDDALIGFAAQWGSPALAVYDGEKIVDILAQDMGYEGAVEYFTAKIECAYVGPGTPLILYRPNED